MKTDELDISVSRRSDRRRRASLWRGPYFFLSGSPIHRAPAHKIMLRIAGWACALASGGVLFGWFIASFWTGLHTMFEGFAICVALVVLSLMCLDSGYSEDG